jgi:hypothetical protein
MRRALGISLLVLGVAASAEAGPITLTDLPSVQFDYVYNGVEQGVFGLAGVEMRDGSGIDPAIDARVFQAYCVDLDGPLPLFDRRVVDATAAPMSTWEDPSDLPSPRTIPGVSNAGAQAAWLYSEFVDDASPDAITRTALQVALWNVLYDVDFTVREGLAPAIFSVRVDDFQTQNDLDIIDAANGYLGALQANLVAANLADATWLQLRVPDCNGNNCDLQDFIGPGQQVNPVPEPASALLLAAGAIGLIATGRRERKT